MPSPGVCLPLSAPHHTVTLSCQAAACALPACLWASGAETPLCFCSPPWIRLWKV